MPEQTTEAPNLPTTATDGSHVSSTDVPDDPAANASAEIFAAMNGTTLTEAGDSEEYGGDQAGVDQQVDALGTADAADGEAPPQ